ncbi:HalOD1 output domain-containing protein [Halovivax sp.]|uniref:HalOD1 output domain-containing protein n=1 Tax=Halovivax sp. TaxID=1935978 RepID=UPI0025C6BC8D|nr:HalOD1 output domain-containing protein [Halovivax sp.]
MGDNTTQSSGEATGGGVDVDVRGYDPSTGAFHDRFDPGGGDDPVVAIVRAVAAVTDRDPTEMPLLFETVHTGALSRVLDASPPGTLEVTFPYAGCDVTVSSDGTVLVRGHPG